MEVPNDQIESGMEVENIESEVNTIFHDYIWNTVPGLTADHQYVIIDGLNFTKTSSNIFTSISYEHVYNIVNTLMINNPNIINPIVLIIFKENNLYVQPPDRVGNIPVFVYSCTTCNRDAYKEANLFYEWVYGTYRLRAMQNQMITTVHGLIINHPKYYNSAYEGADLIKGRAPLYQSQNLTRIREFDEMYRDIHNFSQFVNGLTTSIDRYLIRERSDGSFHGLDDITIIRTLFHNLKSYDDNILFRKVIGLLSLNKKVYVISNDRYDRVGDGVYKFMDKKVGFKDSISYVQTHPGVDAHFDTKYQFYPSYDERIVGDNGLPIHIWRHNVFNVNPARYYDITNYINNYLLIAPNFGHFRHIQSVEPNAIVDDPDNVIPRAVRVSISNRPFLWSPANDQLSTYLFNLTNGGINWPILAISHERPPPGACDIFDYNFTNYMDDSGSQQKKYLKYQNKYLKYKQKYLELKKKLSM